MVMVTFVSHRGQAVTVAARGGQSLMEAAVEHGVDGIEAICGGGCACATCHVLVDPAWMALVGPPSDMEADMLSGVDEANETSRLSCQVKLTQALDGLTVATPPSQ